jgi:hypothetical protein
MCAGKDHLLRVGPLIIVRRYSYSYSYSDTRFHVVFLTGDSSRVLAERTSFRVVEREEEADFINVVFERV